MREDGGYLEILRAIRSLEQQHVEHIKIYGSGNEGRLTGKHETSSMTQFTWGVGTRNTSVRIPNTTARDKKGYFEDRRIAANADPYLTTGMIAKTCAQ
jgi:glutamine synthetase